MGLLAVNLRTFVGSLGVALPDVRNSLTISTMVAELLTTFPALAFALAGPLAPRLVTRIGLRRAVVAGAGPFGYGALQDLTGSWPPLVAIAVISLIIGVAATVVVRSNPLGRDCSAWTPRPSGCALAQTAFELP